MELKEGLEEFISSNPDARELKRALAVNLALKRYRYNEISEILNVSNKFVEKWKKKYLEGGIIGIKLAYQGSKGYLSGEQKAEVLSWLEEGKHWHVSELEFYLESKYGVKYKSPQSYYALFDEAGISWKKSQKYNPKKDPDQVAAKKEEIKKN